MSLLLPEDAEFWSAKENNGPWEKELKKGYVYNKFQPGTNLLITDYPNSGGAEMRSWCHETVAKDWQKFRSTENYNKLAYHTEFPWMADGKDREISMNYGTKNKKGSGKSCGFIHSKVSKTVYIAGMLCLRQIVP